LHHEDNEKDGVFFDITGAVAGDTFVVSIDGGGSEAMSGITFDTALIPEPSTALLGGLGLLALLRRRR
jgi:hypothetical protein